MMEGPVIAPSEGNSDFSGQGDVGLHADNNQKQHDIKSLRKEYKLWLIRKSSLVHNGVEYLKEIENVNKMSPEELMDALKRAKAENSND